nr:hypothetical protein [Tanacetum cinerariifolium]
NRGKTIVNSPQPIYDQEPSMVAEDDETSKDKEIGKLMALISLSFKKIYKPTNNNLRTSSNTSRKNQDNSLRINRSDGYENQRIGNVVGARETVGSTVVQKSRIQCYNCKEFGHVARECQKPKRVKDAAYHREKMLLCKQEEAGIQLNAEQADWRDDTDNDELEDHELESHYMYMAQLQEVPPYAANFGPIFDAEPLQKVSNDDHYNVFAMESEHPEQSGSVPDTYPIEQDVHNETSNKVLIEKLKGEIEDFKNKNKSLESSNNRFKEANNKLSEINNLQYTDFKKSQAELGRRNSVEYASKDKGIVISELKKLIEKLKGKYVNTKSEKSSVIRQPNAFKRVISTTSVSRPRLKSNLIGDRVMRNNSQGKKQDVEDHHKNVKFSKNKTSVTACNDSLKAKTLNVNFMCATCGKCVLNEKHDMCVLKSIKGVNSRTKMPIAMPVSTREPKCTVKQSVAKPIRKTVDSESNQKARNITRKLYERLVKIVLFIVDSGCSKHMTGNLKLLINFVEKFLGTVKFGNDQIVPILGYGDLVKEL